MSFRKPERPGVDQKPALMDIVKRTIIIAYKEDTRRLVAELESEGFSPEVQRPEYTAEQLQFSRNSRTFLNHRNAWEKARKTDGYTLIFEADFVPCRGLGKFPTFWPMKNPMAWGYLYQGSPRIFAALKPDFIRGHTAPLVGYIINAQVAQAMLDFATEEMETYDLKGYFNFDSHLQWGVMGRGAEAYLPRRHYGEHGTGPNPEHGASGRHTHAGEHHADNLMGPLRFMPDYARGSYIRYMRVRLYFQLLGWMRLFFLNKWICETNVYPFDSKTRIKMFAIGVRRLLPGTGW